MTSNSKLAELKEQVRSLSNQQTLIRDKKEQAQEAVSYNEEQIRKRDKEIQSLVRSAFGQSELANVKEREYLKDQLDKVAHRQAVMNEQIITLNDHITDTTALDELYKAKRKELEMNYEQQQTALEGQVRSLETQLEGLKCDLRSIKKEISIERSKLERIVAESKEKAFKNELKQKWIYHRGALMGAGFIGVFIGGFFGWGVFTFFDWIWNSIIGIFGG